MTTGLDALSVTTTAPSSLDGVSPLPDTFAYFISQHPSLNGPATLATADPEGDGLVNLLEYAFSLDPLIADSATGRPQAALIEVNGQD